MMTVPPCSWAEFLARVAEARLPDGWRAGQLWFNLLDSARRDLGNRVRGTNLDPYHRDDRLPALAAWLAEHWDDPRDVTAPAAPPPRPRRRR